MKNKLTYKSSGVSYDAMDPLKGMAQAEGRKTVKNITGSGLREIVESRGESAYIMQQGKSYLAFVEEGLGTKDLVADAMYAITGKTYYDQLAQDTIAMMVNDLTTVGAKPTTILAYWAAGHSDWFSDKKRMQDLVKGWAKACNMSGAVWGGGETTTLIGVVEKTAIDLGGACFGIIPTKKRLVLGENLRRGDAIIFFGSSGIHANGLSLARKLATVLPKGYKTKLPNGKMYGEALLKPTIIYAKLLEALFSKKVDIHYIANITGHGWRKIMRADKNFTYRITKIPPVPEVLQFIIEKAPVDEEEAYGNFNMGAGYAIFVPQKDVDKVLHTAKKHKIQAHHAGVVEKGPKQVIIEPKNITFSAETLNVR